MIHVLSLDVKVTIANLEIQDVMLLQLVFDNYVTSKIGDGYEPDDIMTRIWKQLREGHRLRAVKRAWLIPKLLTFRK